jgi:hypothetical protein
MEFQFTMKKNIYCFFCQKVFLVNLKAIVTMVKKVYLLD